ncbi:MAG: hypothetical protein WDO72_08350 [Pseudomonadota bacterium]
MRPTPPNHDAIAAGARNLLIAGARVRRGGKLLIVTEPPGTGRYQDNLADPLVAEAERLGAHAEVLVLPLTTGPEDLPAPLQAALEQADHTVFLHRIGDQLRFREVSGGGTKVISYALDDDYLAEDFGRTPVAVFDEVLERILALLRRAKRYTIVCANGSRAIMRVGRARKISVKPFSIGNFPTMIIPPISADKLSGRLVLTHALTSTGIHDYPGSELPLPTPVTFHIDNGRIVDISGQTVLAATVDAHLTRVGKLFYGGDRGALFGWHTGINSTTFFRGDALAESDRWSNVAFGSPRYSHFHFCGTEPGEISGAIFDATIAFDDQVVWSNGRLALFSESEIDDIAKRHGVDRRVLTERREIGVPGIA